MFIYNSFDEANKQPFGAVLHHTSITFRLDLSQDRAIEAVNLVVFQDGYWEQPIADVLFESNSSKQASIQFTPIDAGLYFYYFRVQRGADCTFYGCTDGGFGGPCVAYADQDSVQMYQLTVLSQKETVPSWYQAATFYHIFIDRFNNGNSHGEIHGAKHDSFIYGTKQDLPYYIKNTKGEIERWDFYGGNLTGIIAKLPYLKKLGITALYLSPIFEARSNHHYDTGDYLKIDPMLGTLAEFDAFLAAVHGAGMHVILDGVFNHVGADSRYFNLYQHYNSVGASQSKDSLYYEWFDFIDFPTKYHSWWGVSDLPAVNKEDRAYQNFIYGSPGSVIAYWTRRGIDGWRLDVADELPDFFLAGIRKALDQFPEKVLIGEVWEDASHKVAYGQRRHYLEGNMLESVMNYPLRTLLIDLMSGHLATADFTRQLLTLKENYPASAFYGALNNIGTHDTERILSRMNGDVQQLLLLVQLFLTLPGIPCIYYGDEAGLEGGKDPDNRRFFPWDRIDSTIYAGFQKAIALHNEHDVLQWGQCYLLSTVDCLIVIRHLAGMPTFFGFFNPTGEPHKLTVHEADWNQLPNKMRLACKRVVEKVGVVNSKCYEHVFAML